MISAAADAARPEQRMKLCLFGSFRLLRPDGTAIPMTGKRERALLAYLAVHQNSPQPRRKLATLLWGDADDETLLDNLRTCVWSLRKALNDSSRRVVISDNESIGIDAGAFEVDAWDFASLARQGDAASLETAAQLYSGEFLEGLSVDSQDFEAWVRDEVSYFRNIAIDVLDRLAGVLAASGKTEQAIAIGLRAVRLDPLHEKAVRALMRRYAEIGRRTAAFQLYRSLAETLKGEMNAEPEQETRLLFDEISRGERFVPQIAVQDEPEARENENADLMAVPNPQESAPVPQQMPADNSRRRIPFFILTAVFGGVFAATFAAGVLYRPIEKTAASLPAPPEFAFELPKKPSIAVLPFRNLSGDAAEESLADALTNDVTSALSLASEMFVIDGESTATLRNNTTRPVEAAASLGVRYVFEGTVQNAAGHVRVSARLIDSLSGQQVWADLFDREMQDTFALQDDLTLAILTALQVQLTEGEQQRIMLVHGTRNLQAWLISAQGLRAVRRLTAVDNARAREFYRQAVDLDPNFPGAIDGLAWTYLTAARFGWSDMPAQDLATAAGLAKKLVALDPQYPRTYTLLGLLSLMGNDHVHAVEYGEKAVELDPNGSEVAALLGYILTYTGDPERSVEVIRNAMRLSPYYPDWYRWALGRSYRMLGHYDEAAATLAPAQNLDSLNVPHLVELAATYVEQGKADQANEAASAILKAAPKFSVGAWTDHPRVKDAKVLEHERDILRQAGLPE